MISQYEKKRGKCKEAKEKCKKQKKEKKKLKEETVKLAAKLEELHNINAGTDKLI